MSEWVLILSSFIIVPLSRSSCPPLPIHFADPIPSQALPDHVTNTFDLHTNGELQQTKWPQLAPPPSLPHPPRPTPSVLTSEFRCSLPHLVALFSFIHESCLLRGTAWSVLPTTIFCLTILFSTVKPRYHVKSFFACKLSLADDRCSVRMRSFLTESILSEHASLSV